MGALKVFTCGGPGLRHTSVGREVVGERVKDVLSAEGAGPVDSKRDQGRWDEDAILAFGCQRGEVKDRKFRRKNCLEVKSGM
jgi:hypothetical protein